VLVLVLDTATAAVTTGLAWVDAGGVEVRSSRVTVDARRHGEALAPGIRDCLAEAGATPADLAAVVAGVGPGPFTGLRVGLVTAVALATSLGIAGYGVCTLDAVATGSIGPGTDPAQADPAQAGPGQPEPAPAGDRAPFLVATDARRREVYWATYAPDGRRLTGPAVDRPAVVRAWLDEQPAPPRWAAGAGAELYAEILGLPVRGSTHPRVAALAGLAADRVLAGAPGEPLTPLYLRRPDAVEPSARKSVLA
jgi:tRNA threonylcarbamoyl adenosine modification protein YeaZ